MNKPPRTPIAALLLALLAACTDGGTVHLNGVALDPMQRARLEALAGGRLHGGGYWLDFGGRLHDEDGVVADLAAAFRRTTPMAGAAPVFGTAGGLGHRRVEGIGARSSYIGGSDDTFYFLGDNGSSYMGGGY